MEERRVCGVLMLTYMNMLSWTHEPSFDRLDNHLSHKGQPPYKIKDTD